MKNIENTSQQWRRGEKALAHIHFAFAGLPMLESTNDAYRLYLAQALLDDGLPPRKQGSNVEGDYSPVTLSIEKEAL